MNLKHWRACSARFSALLLGALLLAGCASGTSVSESPEAKVPLAPGKARIAVYRTSIMGFGVQPVVSVDGRKTGDCTPNAVFYVDVAPGSHEISARTEATESITVRARANRVTYVECSIGIGLVVGRPHLVEAGASAESKVAGLVFNGKF